MDEIIERVIMGDYISTGGVRLKKNGWEKRITFLPFSYLNYFSQIAPFVFISKRYCTYTNKHFGYISS
jgi:hypothetical protein